jgi:late embryogenesis abundant protein
MCRCVFAATRLALIALMVVGLSACASLEGLHALIQPPQFSQATGERSEIRLLPIQGGRPAGGATVRLWTTVTNPNPFGFTLSTLDAKLFLEDAEAADTSFPLGLPLQARGTETIPLDISISFADIPRLAGVIRQAARGQALNFRLEGIVGIDAGRLGQPTFGPMTLLTGTLAP